LPRIKKSDAAVAADGKVRGVSSKARVSSKSGARSGELVLLADAGYPVWLESQKKQVHAARARAALAVNYELVRIYHKISSELVSNLLTNCRGFTL